MNTTNQTQETNPKDVLFDFADMLASSLGSKEEPNVNKALSVLMTLTEVGNKNPAIVRKIFSEKLMNDIADIMPQVQRGNLGMVDMIAIATRLKHTFENA